ncbi:DENN domain-containing protein 4C, partial [Geodia barretti]
CRRSDLPTVVAIPPDATGLVPNQTYTYPVFPTLNPTLMSSRGGTGMKRARSPSLCSILPGSPSVAKRTRAEKHRDKLALEQAKKSDEMWSRVLLSHVCSLWYVLLPAHLGTQWNKMGVISQALELLENMRKANILPRDENKHIQEGKKRKERKKKEKKRKNYCRDVQC